MTPAEICPQCRGTGFLIIECGGVEAAERCECRRQRSTQAGKTGRPMTSEAAAAAVEVLRDFRFYPKDNPAFDVMVAELLRAMCPTVESAQWLVKRAFMLWNAVWKGPRELRAILCVEYRPQDGIEVNFTALTAGGIVPPEKPLAAAPVLALPPGHMVSADETLDQQVIVSARGKNIGRLPELPPEEQQGAHAFEQVLEEVTTPPEDRKPLPPPRKVRLSDVVRLSADVLPALRVAGTYAPVTRADIDRAIADKPDRREDMVEEARAVLADPAATADHKEMAHEVLRGFDLPDQVPEDPLAYKNTRHQGKPGARFGNHAG